MEINQWSESAGDNTFAVPNGAPEGWTGKQVNETVRELMAVLRRNYLNSYYVEVTYRLPAAGVAKALSVGASNRIDILACNATAYFTADRRVKIVGATTAYGYVVSSAFVGADTQVTVVLESTMPTSPTAIYLAVDDRIRSSAYKKEGSGNGLDADTVDGYHASSLLGGRRNFCINGGFLVWQGYAGVAVSCPAGTRTYVADNIFTLCQGAAVTANRTTTLPAAARSKYGLIVTGNTGTTTCTVAGVRIESAMVPPLKRQITVSALVTNNTGAALVLELNGQTAAAVDDFTSVNPGSSPSGASIANGASARLTFTIDPSGYTNPDNGIQLRFLAPSGALDSASKSITICEIQIETGSVFTEFEVRNVSQEEIACYRYYWLSGSKAEVSTDGLMCVFTGREISGTEFAHGTCLFPVEMRISPTVTVWHNGLSGYAYDLSAVSSDSGYTATRITKRGVRAITKATNIPNGNLIAFNIEADARL